MAAGSNGGGDSNDDIEIELDDGGGPPNNGAVDLGDDGMADAEAALEAMQSFRLAEAALQKNDVAGAHKLAQKAVEGDPTQADYITLLAWIRSLGGNPTAVDEAISTMTQVLEEDPSSERALLYRGKLLARTNRLQEALADFNELLGSNPQHRDAANEVRLLKSRMP
jgi:tetratricopeptide (TPR) repeat protein